MRTPPMWGELPPYARVRPSNLARLMACPASVQEISKTDGKDFSDPSFRDLGTAAHAIAAFRVADTLKLPNPISKLEHDEAIQKISELDPDGSSLDAVDDYVVYLGELVQEEVIASAALEYKLPASFDKRISAGTADFLGYSIQNRRLVVVDFKNGQGVMVDPDNAQTRAYALNALKGTKNKVEQVRVVIVQPRSNFGDKIKEVVYSPQVLKDWAKQVKEKLAEAGSRKPTYNPSADACRWCLAKASCPALQAATAESAAQMDAAGTSMEELERRYTAGLHADIQFQAVKAEMLGRFNSGEAGINYKLVAGRGRRVWANEHLVKDAFVKAFGADKLIPKLPALTAIDRFGAAGKEFVAANAVVREGTGKIAPADDPAPSLTPASVEKFFQDPA